MDNAPIIPIDSQITLPVPDRHEPIPDDKLPPITKPPSDSTEVTLSDGKVRKLRYNAGSIQQLMRKGIDLQMWAIAAGTRLPNGEPDPNAALVLMQRIRQNLDVVVYYGLKLENPHIDRFQDDASPDLVNAMQPHKALEITRPVIIAILRDLNKGVKSTRPPQEGDEENPPPAAPAA